MDEDPFWEHAWWQFAADNACDPFPSRKRAATSSPEVRQRQPRKREEFKRRPLNPEEPAGSLARWRWDPDKSPWWRLMRRRGVRIVGTRAYNKFRRKFRLPLPMVELLVAEAQHVNEFKDKPPGVGQGRGHARHPLILKVLAALRCLGKGVGVEDVEDAAHISAQCLQVFVPRFIRWMAEVQYPRAVKLPEGDHLQELLHVYARLGFPGAYCDTDGVNAQSDTSF